MATESVKIVDPDEGAGYDYASLATWEAGEQADLTAGGGTIAVAKCRTTGGTVDGTYFDIETWTTSVECYIKIWTDPGESYRHPGKYDATKYRIEASRTYPVISIKANNVKIDGIQVHNTDTSSASGDCIGCKTDGNTGIEISNCVLISGESGDGLIFNHGDITVKIWNCVIYCDATQGGSSEGIYFDAVSTGDVYNCTVYNFNDGIERDAGTVTVTNCAVFTNGTDFDGTMTILTCGSDDGDGTNPQGPLDGDWDKEFTNVATYDFSLVVGGNMIGNGTDNPGSGLYSDDIIEIARSSTWDIGAFEYVAVGGVAPTSVLNGPLVGPLGGPI